MLYAGLLLVLFLEYVRPGAYISWINSIKLGTILPILVFVLTVFSVKRSSEVWGQRETKWLIFLLVLILISFFHAQLTLEVEYKFKWVLGYFFVFFMVAALTDSLKKIKGVYIVLITSHFILLILNPEVITDLSTRTYIAAHSFLGDGNDFSLSLCVLFPMALFLARDAKSVIVRYIWYGALILIVVAVIGGQSRGAALGLSSILFYLWLKSNRKVSGIFAIGIVGLVVILVAAPQFFSRMSTLSDPLAESSASKRTVFWKSGFRMALAYPITGVGAGNFAYAFGTRFRPHAGFGPKAAHSVYFGILGDLGFPGIIFILSYLIGGFRITERKINTIRAGPKEGDAGRYEFLLMCQNASLIAFSVSGTFLSAQYYPHYFIIGGIMVAARLLPEIKELTEPKA